MNVQGGYSLDVFPYRDDAVGVATESIKRVKNLRGLIDKVGMKTLEAVIASGDAAQASRLIREGLFG